ncbi:MAG TPA: hypothetical protein VGX68_18190 [Thermoanaerobaculia bacterium]|jgi:hypothetical protein|nr:hypothetical protein [Thermoanaerobaculia bacterium]
MLRKRRGESIFWLLVLAVLAPAVAAESAAPQRPNLQGKWKLNEDLTARMREEDRPRGGMGGFHGGMGRGPGGGRGGGFPGGGMGDHGQGRHREGAPPSLAALDELTIVQADGQVTITDKEGRSRVLKTDGSKVRDEKAPGGPVELRANWERDGTLTVRIKPDEGAKRTESYIVSNDGKHLYVTLTLEGGPREFKIRQAYDPMVEEKPPS